MKTRHVRSVVTLSIIFFVCLIGAVSVSHATWMIDTVDGGKTFDLTSQQAMALDSNGNPHIVYGADHLYHAYFDGTTWHSEMIDSAAGVGSEAMIYIDSADHIHIFYADYVAQNLAFADLYISKPFYRYATNAHGSWTVEPLDFIYSSNFFYVDPSGVVKLVYHLWDANQTAMIATNESGVWHSEPIDLPVSNFNNLVFDAAGAIHLLYRDWPDIMYATNASGEWRTGVVDSVWNGGRYMALAVGTDGQVHIVYSDGGYIDNRKLKYATGTFGAWNVEIIEDLGSANALGEIAVRVDAGNTVHIAYHDNAHDNLKYARGTAGSWTTETVDNSPGNVGESPSLVLDQAGMVHISYWDAGNAAVKYAEGSQGSWTLQTIESGSTDDGTLLAVAADPVGRLHMIYKDSGRDELKYAEGVYGAWTVQTLASNYTYFWGDEPRIALDSSDHAHVLYHDQNSNELKYGTNRSGSWAFQTVYSGEPEGYPVLVIDSLGRCHVIYQDTGQLVHATNAAGVWTSEVVAGESDHYYGVSIDSSDHLHIAYAHDDSSTNSSTLFHATNVSGSWQREALTTVDCPDGDCFDDSLEIKNDITGSTHIVYDYTIYDEMTEEYISDMSYVTNSSGSWTTETLDFGKSPEPINMQVDPAGTVHMVYKYYSDSGEDCYVGYAARISGTWQTETVTGVGHWFEGAAVFDSSNNPYISWNQGYHKLQYATGTFGSWSIKTVEDSIAYSWNDIAIDAMNNVHIVYREYGNRILKYATTSSTEEYGPSGTDHSYDGNADGTPDSEQDNVASFHTYDGADYLTLSSSEGTTLSTIEPVENPSPINTPEGTDFPLGFVKFVVTDVTPGGAVTVRLYLPEGTTISTYYKYGPTPDNQQPHWYEFLYDGTTGAVISDNIVTLYFVDGQRGDHDLTANGIIVDPGAPAFAGIPGDLDGDGDVDRNDVNIIMSHRNQSAEVCPECDLDGDGTITVLDARKLILQCTRPRCATSGPE